MMLHSLQNLHKRRLQTRGFTLVELALVLVVTALLLGMAAKGLGLLDQGKGDQLVMQVRQLETEAKEFQRTQQRWPGDCNGNGRFDASIYDFVYPATGPSAIGEAARTARADLFDYAAALPTAATSCMAGLTAAKFDFNVGLNDLKSAGLLSTAVPNRIAATHAAGDFMAMAQVLVTNSGTGQDEGYNAIVLFNVPVSMARKLAVAMDGFDGDAAYKGRVRRLRFVGAYSSDMFETSWLNNVAVTNETQDSLITIAYFFDQLPLPITYQ